VVDPLTAEAQYEKVHIRGVDELATDDIKQFAIDNFEAEEPSRIEWIDDTSANIVYSSDRVGLLALTAFTQIGEEEVSSLPPLRLRTAKSLSTQPESVLQVRSAVKTDRKKPRAHEASRFYLMHPEHDPREKLRRELAERRHQGRRNDDDGEYKRRRFDEREHQRRRDRGGDAGYNANMYDDNVDMSSGDSRRRGSSAGLSDMEDHNRSKRGRKRELFPDHAGCSSNLQRNRSASPPNDIDEEHWDASDRQTSRRRFRERSPQQPRTDATGGRELFPSQSAEPTSDQNARELFPNKTAATFLKKELFPNKSSLSNHRRSDAFDAADETADLFSRRIGASLVDGVQDRTVSHHVDDDEVSHGSGHSIRGAAQDKGISIRGAANGVSIKGSASVRELFPSRYNPNARKELFSDKLEGRGGRRRKAEDMFY
jgi:Nuclear cap-binding protein subunit 3